MTLFGITVNFITQKLKSRTLILSQFSLATGFFEGTIENILHIHIPGLTDQSPNRLNSLVSVIYQLQKKNKNLL